MSFTDCVDVQDVRDFRIDCELVEICCTDAQILLELEIAYEMVKIITNTEWCPVTTCRYFDGSGSDKLFFVSQTSDYLNSLTSVEDIACCSPEGTLSDITNHGTWLEMTCTGCFPCGQKNIKVCGSWGRTMPAGVKKAIILLALEGIQPGITGLETPNGVRSATWEDFRISYSVEERPRGVLTTGYQEIDDLLAIYTPTLSQVSFTAIPENSNCLPRECGIVVNRGCCNSGRGCQCGNC